jgi:hypothetical protein
LREIGIVVSADQRDRGGGTVDDIISQRGGRGRGPWPRLVAILAVLVVATVLIVEHLPHGQPATTQPRPAPVTLAPLPGPVAAAAGVSGLVMPRDASLRLPSAGQQPGWLWPATGRTQPIGGLPVDKSGYRFIRVDDGWAVQATSDARLRCGTCAGPLLPVYFLADNARSVTPAGAANEVAPGAAADALWLTSYPAGVDMSTASGAAQEINVATGLARAAGPRVTLPAGYAIDQGTDRGLLLAPAAPSGTATYELWNPAAPHAVSRTFDGVLAASASQVAWATRCEPVCGVEVLDLVTGRDTVVRLPGATSAVNGAFSPDGKFLTLQVSYDNLGDDGALAMQLDVVSMTGGKPVVAKVMRVSSDALVGFGWAAGGDDLVTELNFMAKLQIVAWRSGAHGLTVAVISPGPESASLVVG